MSTRAAEAPAARRIAARAFKAAPARRAAREVRIVHAMQILAMETDAMDPRATQTGAMEMDATPTRASARRIPPAPDPRRCAMPLREIPYVRKFHPRIHRAHRDRVRRRNLISAPPGIALTPSPGTPGGGWAEGSAALT